ncbi:hypothetical protein CFI10_02630 [Marinobacterium iners]|uniref:YeiH family protein n=1 Tax=Marinobacterium iners TaxID=48076 RepID=UPI001A8FBD81|nr:putative sulfate exporter family transporter [Marinobacterium iners]QSR33888.1 hypothetical protein CFI10_02630 [Marinobacterium iners]
MFVTLLSRHYLFTGLALAFFLTLTALSLVQMPLPIFPLLGPLTLAMLLGMAAGHCSRSDFTQQAERGLQFSRHYLLRAGIILYGLRISLDDLSTAGWGALLIDAIVVTTILLTAAWAGVRWFRLDVPTALLIGAGSAICGAAAVLATAPALRARNQAVPVAIATVVLFGSAAMLLYPWLFTQTWVMTLLDGSARDFGRLVGATTHEVAQVTAIAATLPADGAHTAVVTKLMRVMLLVPVLLVLSRLFQHRTENSETPSLTIPWFALVFMLLPLVNSLELIPAAILTWLHQLDQLLLGMAMTALGFATRISAIRAAGWRPLALGALLFVLLLTGGALLTLLIS